MFARMLGKCAGLAVALALAGAPQAWAQKYGGVLKVLARGVATLSIHEDSGGAGPWGSYPLFSNLVEFDPHAKTVSVDALVLDLAEKWGWSADGKALTFTLRPGAKWHDGKPVTSADVKDTYDVVRGVSQKRLKTSPRRGWYGNVTSLTTNGDLEVTFHLKRPQPALLAMLASNSGAVYPAHVATAKMRTEPVGSGPFVLKAFKRDSSLTYARNPDYYMKGRPYLDGIEYSLIGNVTTAMAALIAHQADVAYPNDVNPPIAKSLRNSRAPLVLVPNYSLTYQNVLMVRNKPPFSNARLREAVNLALDRRDWLKAVTLNEGLLGGPMAPAPNGIWGLPLAELDKLPGFGDAAKDKARSRATLAELGYGPDNPLRVKMSCLNIASYVMLANWMIAQLKEVGIEATLEQVERGAWYPRVARHDFVMAANLTAIPGDDPDIQYYENYTCSAARNYSAYCNPETDRMIDAQSMERDPARRVQLVHAVEQELARDAARPAFGFTSAQYAHWPQVKDYMRNPSNLVSFRFTNTWLDR